MTVTLISLKLLFGNNQPIMNQTVQLKAGSGRSTKRMSDFEGYCNVAGGKWKDGDTLTVTINGYTAYTQLRSGINKLQVTMPVTRDNGSLKVKIVDTSNRKPVAGISVAVVVQGKQYAVTMKSDSMGMITINSQSGITSKDKI